MRLESKVLKSLFFIFALFFSLVAVVSADDKAMYIVEFNSAFSGKTWAAKKVMEKKLSFFSANKNKSLKYKATYDAVMSGVAVELSKKEAAFVLRLPFVKRVEKDSLVFPDMGWGLDRVNQRNLPLDNNFSRPFRGAGVNIYIIDTGINPNHVEFSGRVGAVVSTVSGGARDCNGHGTHVASIAAGASFGVASDAIVNSVRVSNDCALGSAFVSDVISGLNWVVRNAAPNSVVNLSIFSGSFSILYAMENVTERGHVIVTSGGNNNRDACTDPENRKSRASLSVGASTITDRRASFSNFGTCINLFAPGNSILGARYTSNTGSIRMSGTSQASPFVAGIAASYRQRFPDASAYEVMEAIIDGATTGVISNASGTPNRLAYTDIGRPASYWQVVNIIQAPVINPILPKPGCNTGQIYIQSGSEGLARRWRCQ